MVGRSLGRALLSIAALVCVCLPSRSARAEWHAHGSGLRYWLPTQWPTAPLEAGTIARGAGGVAVWVLPLNAAQLVTASAPEALLATVVSRPRLLSRASSISPLIATGRWSHGTATFERRSVHWFARVVRLDAGHGALAVGITPRSSLPSSDAELLDAALNSAHLAGAPGVVRYAGMGAFTTAGRVARTISTPVVFELRGAGEQRTVFMPDLDDQTCTFRARATPTGTLRLESDQACPFARYGFTMVLVGGQFEFSGANTTFFASGRMSFMARVSQRGPMIAGTVSFNWRLQGTRPAP
jgi:hypothetical protein